ncbi:MAG: 1-deoxy-D-xylulose-5-phosphate reductoisomerase [Hydrogenophilales bacterium CG03_land_8_20_14_0_80_62_28]|nr:1-deoxy-D-xylulose-5-phosphate reductoisomerase [Betaproteobacteria bacterium]OIO77645.1 MAG: 1-deoxy-D-xylulose-5-phosphate reductoisomerase [Hydrogenophilaceae bacterium CG1_02_62_390]PIV24476.1 MAG: 1-deoxy-D-xylulose-5-phosphate reductoisomerase [Hydrogenophilales bacterium CG03_land_8_20_14_0_80_62_28]PIW37882.1 MAG: 1-deoxy-D-xylulose-5-phosphate reductoisomerase [Hydrogenophilales bacterium CG15_BIG_FIL_POST_REV_8_21_14_020_62_31]PIW70886.1 MAG: 1-deoxy-D-xylulose-5-phosphate reductoi
MRYLTILGSTGTIGVNTLDVAARHPDRFKVVALSGQNQIAKLAQQCRQFRPKYAVVLDSARALALKTALADINIEVLYGVDALEQIASLPEVDTVMAAIVGAAGMRPALAAARAGKRVLLANKETLVMAGQFFMAAVRASGATLLPIDSEHNAIFQSMPEPYSGDMAAHGIRRILLTASGGPFRTRPVETLAAVTPEEAVAHPNWSMGKKISVDSATMMNKGLEVIEAHWLFNARPDQIDVVVHPQSIVHSMVEYQDGSVLAQLSNPDMRIPIAHALAYPERVATGVPWLDLAKLGQLTFEAPDTDRFPCLKLAFQALAAGGSSTTVLNAANEEVVAAFLDRRIPYLAIPELLGRVLERLGGQPAASLAELEAVDAEARALAIKLIAAR